MVKHLVQDCDEVNISITYINFLVVAPIAAKMNVGKETAEMHLMDRNTQCFVFRGHWFALESF